jgi:hypothetical protein
MTANLLTTASQVMCAHGGQATLLTSNAQVSAGGSMVLLETDVHLVSGCSFTVGTVYSPCVRIEWSAGATKCSVGGVAPLTQSSVGKCLGASGAPQGVASVVQTQLKASAT